jgi:dephospho-CoA kinase
MIIGLSGYARSGKDEVAKILVEDYGYERVAFADKIREFLYETNPQIGGNRLQHLVLTYGWDVAKSQPEVRHLLQSVGVAARKLFGDNFWINQALNPHIYEHPIVGINKNIVVTDIRFTNEAETIKSLGGQIWRIKRNGVEAINNHVSEHEMDGYSVDMILKNEGTLEDLRKMVSNRMKFALNAN